MYTWNSYIEGPRWASVGDGLRKSIINYRSAGFDLSLEKLEVSKGWFRETTYFTITSNKEEDLLAFQKAIVKALKEY